MKRFTIAVAILFAAVAGAAVPTAQSEQAPPQTAPTEPAQPRPTLVRVVVHRPKSHRTIVRRFTPPAHPAPSYVFGVIAPAEAARFGATLSVLRCRIRRESHGVYNAHNGQYDGVGQFADETFGRGLRTMPHGVRLRYRRDVKIHARVARIYSDGHVVHRVGKRSWQRQLVIMRGELPRYPIKTHAWAQVRIMAQALAGRSAVAASEWSTKSFCG